MLNASACCAVLRVVAPVQANVRNYYMQFTEGPNDPSGGPPLDPKQPDMMHLRANMAARDMQRMGSGGPGGPPFMGPPGGPMGMGPRGEKQQAAGSSRGAVAVGWQPGRQHEPLLRPHSVMLLRSGLLQWGTAGCPCATTFGSAPVLLASLHGLGGLECKLCAASCMPAHLCLAALSSSSTAAVQHHAWNCCCFSGTYHGPCQHRRSTGCLSIEVLALC